jgi:hypothetical protein
MTDAEPPEDAPASEKPAGSRLRRFGAYIRERYCRMDPRTAGLYRIVVGFLCAADTIRRWAVARTFYSNEGVLTNHYHLYRPSGGHNFSIHHAFSSLGEVHVIFAISVLCHLLLMIGWRSRLFAVLSFILVTSLDNRLVLVENGGYVVVNLVAMYAMFLPIERRFSVDAWIRSWRERHEKSVAELNERKPSSWETDDYVSLAVGLVLLNLAVVYFFNVVNKSGDIWRKGETVHYVLYINRMVTWLGVGLRKILPMPVARGLAWWTLCHEALLCVLLLWPYGRRVTRTLAILGIWALHLVFGTMFRLGPFAWFMIGWSFAVVGREQWDLLERWARRRASARTVICDRGSPLALTLARAIARLDGLGLVSFEESAIDAERPPLLAVRDDKGVVWTGSAALREIALALPAGRYFYLAIVVCSLGLVPFLYRWAEQNRAAVSRFFALDRPAPDASNTGSPVGSAIARTRGYAREGLIAYLGICFLVQAVIENKSIPPAVRDKIKMPAPMAATILYPRLFQGWGMFAPNPITDDGILAVDARTIDGRRIDPFTGKEPDLDLTDSGDLGVGQVQQDYFNRIRLDRNTVYRHGLSEYLQEWHLRTGDKNDELVSYDVYWVRDKLPEPGMDRPYDNRLQAILTWRKPGYRPPPGQPPLPKQPRLESADTPQPPKGTKTFFGWRVPDFMQY